MKFNFLLGALAVLVAHSSVLPSDCDPQSLPSEASCPATMSNECVELSLEMKNLILETGNYFLETSQLCSECLINCYDAVTRGESHVSIKDLQGALPDLRVYVSLSESRAIRPDTFTGNPPVGANACGLTAILQAIQGLQCSLASSFTCQADCNISLSILVDIKDTLTTCCADLMATITTCCSILETLTTNCAHTPICEAVTITNPGAYCLCTFITGVITIEANDVDLDLNNYSISGGTNGIVIAPGVQRVNIHNGGINTTSAQAIVVGDGARFITLDGIEITDISSGSEIFAIEFMGSSTGRITDCLISNVTISRVEAGIFLHNTDFVIVDNCHISDCLSPTSSAVGILLVGDDISVPCLSNEITNCSVANCTAELFSAGGMAAVISLNTLFAHNYINNITGQEYTLGIESAISPGTTIKDCVVSDINSTSTFIPCLGLWLIGSSASVVADCQVIGIGISSPDVPASVGLFVGSSSGCVINNVAIAEVGISVTGAGVWIDSDSSNLILRNCSCADIVGSSIGAGFNILGSDIVFQDCSVEGVTAPSAVGFDGGNADIPAVTSQLTYIRCHVANVNGETDARGFRINTSTGYLGACDVERIIVPPNEAGPISRGFDVLITSTEILLDSCVATEIRNPAAGEAFYIEGFSVQLQNCTASYCREGIIVIATSATNPIIDQCRATNCTDTGILIDLASDAVITNCYAAKNLSNYIGAVNHIADVGTAYTDPSVVTGFNLSA